VNMELLFLGANLRIFLFEIKFLYSLFFWESFEFGLECCTDTFYDTKLLTLRFPVYSCDGLSL